MKWHRVYSMPTDRTTGIICDQHIARDGFHTPRNDPVLLRRIRFKDPDTHKTFFFLTHPMTLPAMTLCALYKNRWQVELFFKWIKQPLRIKRFFGTSENAVKTQIRIAVSVYLLVAIIKKKFNWRSPSTLCYKSYPLPSSKKCPYSKLFRLTTPLPQKITRVTH
jgi:IS4 transposase